MRASQTVGSSTLSYIEASFFFIVLYHIHGSSESSHLLKIIDTKLPS
jgi:hypothetical protein